MPVPVTTPTATDTKASDGFISPRSALLVIVVLGLLLFLIRATGPVDLADGYHQERAASYVADAIRNGNWICQYGHYDDITSKPPMYTWLGALFSLPFGQPNWFSLILTGGLATLFSAWILLKWGGKYLGGFTGFLAALVFLLSPGAAKEMGLVRIDGFFSFTVLATAVLAFESWRKGSGWIWFWIAAAVSTLTKGPLGVLLGAAGLLAALWERKSGERAPVSGSHWLGIIVFFLLTGGWFAAAYWQMGPALVDKMIGKELVGHAVGVKPGDSFWSNCYKPTVYLGRGFLPWILFTLPGLWRIWKHPAADAWQRRFERFVFCWFFVGLLVFSLASHQRPDLIFPLIPAAALIAGMELARWLGRFGRTGVLRFIATVTVIGVVAIILHYDVIDGRKPKVLVTLGVKELAKQVQKQGGGEFPLTYTDSPYGLQFYLNTRRSLVSIADAARVLKGESAAFVVVTNVAELQKEVGPEVPLHDLASTPVVAHESTHIASNHPRLEWTEHMRCIIKPVEMEFQNITAFRTQAGEFTVSSGKDGGRVVLMPYPSDARVRVEVLDGAPPEIGLLEPGKAFAISVRNEVKLKIALVR